MKNVFEKARQGRGGWWCLLLLAGLAGCQAVREIAALRQVHFTLDRVAGVRLAGIEVERIRSYEDLSAMDVARLTGAMARRELPLDLEVHLLAENPPENTVSARLVRMDWTLLIDETETISGRFDDTVVLPPGEPKPVTFAVSLDLIDFFDRNARDLVELALAISGQGGAPKRVSLRASPIIDTALGPIRYPQPITIVSREVGS
ncbi:MAG: hypothetical protein KatS3mg044_1187 [Rhodothermaceae bacterium]|nr:MAG: hypothetical protein KatS3mg044_1187 [Rhodothermaceae bacterium]